MPMMADKPMPTGNLQLAIQARSFNHYMYIRSTNTNHPLRYTQNKVARVLFENKVDHASTYSRHSPWSLTQ
jgi:endo-1,3(4)-beta-glucanase